MEIRTNDHIKIFALQEELHMLFPYLKLEFFAKIHSRHGDFLKKLSSHDSITLVKSNKGPSNDEITVNPAMTVNELEQKFRDIYGLEIKVLRKSGKLWLETTITDSWTLEKQNREGEALSKNN